MDSQLITEQEISREITILKQLKHPNIVEYQDAFQVVFWIFLEQWFLLYCYGILWWRWSKKFIGQWWGGTRWEGKEDFKYVMASLLRFQIS